VRGARGSLRADPATLHEATVDTGPGHDQVQHRLRIGQHRSAGVGPLAGGR